MEKRDIAITIQNMVQFYSIKNGIDALLKKGYNVDIYIPQTTHESGIGDLYDDTYNTLINSNYVLKREADDNITYKILMEPYPMDIYLKINHKYRLKYKYAPIPAKPNLTCTASTNIYYDGIICYGDYDASYLKAYSNTYVIGNMKYIGFKRNPVLINNKPILLFLPTYGENSSIDKLIDELKKLKNNYYIIVKSHHGTSYLKNELYRINKLKEIVDEFYDHSTQLIDLLSKAHVVLSDNSGAIFEAIYAEVPIAIFSNDLNANKLNDFNTTQYDIVNEGYIPYTKEPSNIKQVLDEAMSDEYNEKIKEIKGKLFHISDDPVEEFVNVINLFMNDKINKKYKALHDLIVNSYANYSDLKNENNQIKYENDQIKKELQLSSQKLEEFKKEIDQKDTIIYYYKTGKLYKLSNKIYNIYHKINKKRSKNE